MTRPASIDLEAAQLTVYDALQAGRVPPIAEDLRDASRPATVLGDASRAAAGAPARVPLDVADHEGRVCAWCTGPIPAGARADAETCGVVCRKRRWRFRRAIAAGRVPPVVDERDASLSPAGPRHPSRRAAAQRDASPGPKRFAYADPPYPGKADYYPEGQEVDHHALVARLEREYPDGWALSTSADALGLVLPMCPASTRVCVWRRRTRPTRSRRALSAWEPLLVVGGRPLPTERPQEILDVLDYRGRYDAFPGALVGMKPPEFAVWMFAQLGAQPGDELADLFPGSGAIGRAWALYTSLGDLGDTRDASARAARDAS